MLALKHSIFIVSLLFCVPTAQQIGAVRLDLLSFVILRSGRVSDYTRENGILIYFTFLVSYISHLSLIIMAIFPLLSTEVSLF